MLLSFASGSPTASPIARDTSVSPWGGTVTASISDASGRYLFFCNGNAIYDAQGRMMSNGPLNTIIFSDPWWQLLEHQTTVITPAPGRPNHYYTFYWDKAVAPRQGASLHYAVVDMRLNGGRGGEVARSAALTSTTKPRVTAVRHRNNRDFWLLTRDEDTRGFVALLLTPQGVAATPVVSMAGEAQYPLVTDLQAAPDGLQLATGGVVVQGRTATSPGTALGSVCLYDFDNRTGVVSRERVIRQMAFPSYGTDGQGRPVPNGARLFSLSFSPDGTKLYTSESNPLPATRRFADIWQYDLSRPSLAAIAASRFRVSDVPTPAPSAVDTTIIPSQLQLTPTGEIWVPIFDYALPYNPATGALSRLYSAVIRYPNVAGAGCGFARRGFAYQPGQQPDTFPNLVTNMLFAPAALNYEAGCPEDSVAFWASSAGDPAGPALERRGRGARPLFLPARLPRLPRHPPAAARHRHAPALSFHFATHPLVTCFAHACATISGPPARGPAPGTGPGWQRTHRVAVE